MIARVDTVSDSAEALEAPGFPEQMMSQENVEIVRRLFTEFGLSVTGSPGGGARRS